MSSRENERRHPGQFNRGRGHNRGGSSNRSGSTKSESRGNTNNPNDEKKHPQQGNRGNPKNPNEKNIHHQGSKGKKNVNRNPQHQGFDQEAFSYQQLGVTGFNTGGLACQLPPNRPFPPNFNPNARLPPTVNQPIQLPHKMSDTRTEIRVFTGSRESNAAKVNFRQVSSNYNSQNVRQMQPNNRGSLFHHGRGFHPTNRPNFRPHFQNPPMHNQNLQPNHNSRGQNDPQRYNTQQHYNSRGQNHPTHFNTQPHNFHGQNNPAYFDPIFYQTSAQANNSSNVNANKFPPAPTSKAPIFKFKKKPQLKKDVSQSSLNSDRQVPQAKQDMKGPQRKANRKLPKRRQKKPNLWKKKPEKAEVAPLFSFISNVTESKPKEFSSEDEDVTSMSRCSSEESVWTTNISDDGEEDSSDESEVASEISITSSVQSSAVPESHSASGLVTPKVDGIISVFWDIENCPVPREKSAVDFVKKIRTTFYQGRTEANFYVVCDVTNLSNILTEELNLSDATVIHMSSKNKNAADTKISSLLLEFRDSYKAGNAAIVLVSGDSDFSTILNNLHYKFHVHINLVCKNNARHSLVEAAQNCIFYEDFVKDLPTRAKSDSIDYIMIVSNYSENVTLKKVKTVISDKLKGINCRVTKNDASSVAVFFPDQCARDRALTLLKGFSIDGKEVQISCTEAKKRNLTDNDNKQVKKNSAEKKSKTKVHVVKEEKNIEEKKIFESSANENQPAVKKSSESKVHVVKTKNIEEKNTIESSIKESPLANKKKSKKQERNVIDTDKNDNKSKGATLWICVNVCFRYSDFWTNKLSEMWNSTDFVLNWEGDSDQGLCLASFKSLSQAQKAKKILQKAQITNPSSPKFLKLIKQDDISNTLTSFSRSSKDLNASKLREHIQIIESKRESCLNKHKEMVKKLSSEPTPSVPGAAEAKMAKLAELNEQKVTFLNYTQNLMEKVNNIDLECEIFDDQLDLHLKDFYRECNCLSTALPIYAKKNAILKTIKKYQVVVIRAETGSGKSTQLTQYIWREDLSRKGLVICTQPRKIAAITLAKHVSSQVCSSLGEVVGYQVGLNGKRSENTAILYVTDFTMLKMIVNNDLKDVSCIIVDEAHERTVYTDLLLGMIKSCLKLKPELKLIITSATIDTSVFKIYLGLQDNAILEVSGRTFPVEDIWMNKEVTLGWDYFTKTIDTAYDILKQEPGDVLVFLTTPFETEKAVKIFSEKIGGKMAKSIKIYQLHGKLDVQEQQKVFEKTPDGIRKVVFATNCAETSVTIPGIRYVVDCGMVKESKYDAGRNMNVLSVNFVSQSSAEQRRGRAGRTQVGKCYRLYSRVNYDTMEKTSVPEILRVNLGQALLRLMKIGVKDPLKFDFVQSPPKESLSLTMKQLINLNAVSKDDLSLTTLGENMSYLPLEPRLSFLVLTGIEQNIGYEAVVLAALVTISRNIFFRTSENKSDADVKKLRFCQSESDFLTFFEVYKEWATVPKQAKSKWCTLNCINARSLRTAQELVNELVTIIQREIKINIATKFNDTFVSDTLLELVFRSFYQNICIFSGYHRLGYRSLDVAGDLIIHPSSSLYTYGKWRPQFLVYDTLLQTNQTYLINVSPMTEEAIEVCMDKYGIEINIEAMKSLQLTTYAFSPIGKSIMLNDIIGKQGIKIRQLENILKTQIGTDRLAVEADVHKGEVKVYAPQSTFKEVESVLCPIIAKGQERLSEYQEVLIYPELRSILSPGIVIQDVVLPGEYRDVKVTLNADIEIKEVVDKLQTVGPVRSVREWKNYFKVTFTSPVHAKLSLEKFKSEPDFKLQEIIKFNALAGRFNQYKVFVSFMRRPGTGCAFVTIDPHTDPNVHQMMLSLRLDTFKNNQLQCSISKKSQDVRITNLPLDTERRDLEKFLQQHIPTDCKISKCAVIRAKEYESSSQEIESIKRMIIQLFSDFTPSNKFSVELKKPNAKSFTWNACVFFQEACNGEAAVRILKSRTHTLFTGLELKPSLQTYLSCKLDVYLAIKDQVEEALKYFKDHSVPGNTLEIKIYPKEGGYVQIHITSNNISDMSNARKSILNLILGDNLVCNSMEKLLSASGLKFLKEISCEKCYIDINTHKKAITIFGDVSAVNAKKVEICEYLDKLEKEDIEDINLMPETGRPGVLRLLLSKYGHDLMKLKEDCDLAGIEVNSYRHILSVKGSKEAVSKCLDVVKDLKEKVELNEYPEDAENCPVCFDNVSGDSHRLEHCGHLYCKECILLWFQNAKDFPLTCIMTDCGTPVVYADLQWAIKEVKSFETEMFRKSLMAFVQTRDDIAYCPTPDCQMIFRISNNGTVFDCPLCANSICTQCKELYHYGMSCSLYQCCKADSDYGLKVWMSENPSGRKKCPKCSAPIEKDGGCNHMNCWKCQCHMCWLCMQTFSTDDLVYAHQPFCPRKVV
ncbi:hypothetical protein JTE90_019774 [Oedothorax gibbosus]|uniref:Uncharacterized protein n=1 Tax=Oedothorax gibbosus TaxID=931172 RepID=A0AAV6UM48_9ARAC|nr:hypothetical protein JTE90_019774 [Oedothorax gibbosus]